MASTATKRKPARSMRTRKTSTARRTARKPAARRR